MMSIPGDRSVETPILVNGQETTAWGVWRREFDAMLLDEAQRAGAAFFEEARNVSVRGDGIKTVSFDSKHREAHELEAWVVADARGADPEQCKGPFQAMGLAAEFENSSVPPALVSVHYVPEGHCGIDPIGKGRITVGYVADPALFNKGGRDPDVILGIFRKQNANLDRLMGSARQITPWKGVKIHLVKRFRFFEGGMFQVGDAAGNVNPVGGIGLTCALQSSRMLAALLKPHSPTCVPVKEVAFYYAKLWRRELLPRLRMSRFLGRLSHGKIAAGLMMKLFRAFPGILRSAFQKQHALIDLTLAD